MNCTKKMKTYAWTKCASHNFNEGQDEWCGHNYEHCTQIVLNARGFCFVLLSTFIEYVLSTILLNHSSIHPSIYVAIHLHTSYMVNVVYLFFLHVYFMHRKSLNISHSIFTISFSFAPSFLFSLVVRYFVICYYLYCRLHINYFSTYL